MVFSFPIKQAWYLPVYQHEKSEGLSDTDSVASNSQKSIYSCERERRSCWSTWIPYSVILCLILSNSYTWAKLHSSAIKNVVFSPASSAVRYENIVATSGVLGDNSPYQGPPSEENNALWEDLYQFGISRIPMSDAAKLVNRTVPIASDPGYYAVTLDVFHQLHCLNMIRKQIWSDGPMPEDGPMNPIHLDHCIDSLRQSLQCSSPITPLPYVWYLHYKMALPATGVVRTCRDFDGLREWARERQSFTFDLDVRVDDPLGNVETTAQPE